MPAPKEILALVEKFDRHRESYESAAYNETQLRREFLDPMFAALGWDVQNVDGAAEAYKDVIHEDAIKVGEFTKAPDYGFRIGGTRKFFVEAKKPSKKLKDDAEAAFQLRRYAWSAKLPLSILTDFQEFAVYDTRLKPSPKDKASVGRVLYFTYAEYAEKWDEIAGIFSQDAVRQGAFDKFAEAKRPRRGTTAVDEAFLEEIEGWREALAKNIAARNSKRDVREINFAVQRIIDRIIFLRIAEDRGIEPYGRLQGLLNGKNVYARLFELFEQADDRYNSGLFHFKEERGRAERPDELTPGLKVDDEVLKDIIEDLYPPRSPYAFSVIPADILGAVYEQFLGKVIRLTAGHHVKVEEKPEVRKAGGVYYTPTYIVEYIVKQTVGKLLEGKTPKQAAELKVLDPACGSGSFLIGAYQHLLDWHRDWYVNDGVEKHRKVLYQGMGGEWRLTTKERTRILLNNIYGVDIDQQAVEVTKLSLLLKVLEGGSPDALQREFWGAHERVLPDLGNNIKCGNSLIGPDFYDDKQLDLLGDEERYRINAFDWDKEFDRVMRNHGGFHAVIGNPPYIPTELMTEGEREYYQGKFEQLDGKYDSSVLFILELTGRLAKNGRLGFISSITWQTGENYTRVRQHLLETRGIVSLVNLPFDVFKDAYVDTGVYVLSKEQRKGYSVYVYPKKAHVGSMESIPMTEISLALVGPPTFKFVLDAAANRLLAKATSGASVAPLGSFTISTQGLAGNRFTRKPKARGPQWFPFLEDGQAHRYSLDIGRVTSCDMSVHASLKRFYGADPKILIRRVISRQDRLLAAFSDHTMVFKKDINPFVVTDAAWDPFYVLSVVNSRFASYLYVNTSSIATKDDFRQTTLAELRRMPIPVLAKADKRARRLAELAGEMTRLSEEMRGSKELRRRELVTRQMGALDDQIDQLVYELYGLTDEEILIVEEATGGAGAKD